MDKKTSRRTYLCISFLFVLLFIGLVRLFIIATDPNLEEAANSQSSYSVRLYRKRGTVYDCNMLKLTNQKTKQVTVFSPTQQGIISAATVLKEAEKENTLAKLKQGFPALVSGGFVMPGTTVASIPDNSLNALANHLLGYTDSTGHGVCGIEQSMDNLLWTNDYVSVDFITDSKSNILPGISAEIDNGSSVATDIVLTIDSRIQKIVETAIQGQGSVAAVVIDAKNGKIKAMASRPTYDISNLADCLDNEDSPFINRAITPYSVGSVFKPLIAAAAIENGLESFTVNCNGSVTIDGRVFKCHKLAGHGQVDMEKALSESCNVFFYQIGNAVGGEKIYEFSKLFSFGESFDIGCNVTLKQGEITDKQTLKASQSAVANISIGQGNLLLSPLNISFLYQAIANDGIYYTPNLLEATIKGTSSTKQEETPFVRAMKQKTARMLKKYLISTVENGTGKKAYNEKFVSGGKTGTAQTGWIKNGKSILNGWFCGFAEIRGCEYVISVIKEDVSSGSDDCAPIFAEIAQKIYQNIL